MIARDAPNQLSHPTPAPHATANTSARASSARPRQPRTTRAHAPRPAQLSTASQQTARAARAYCPAETRDSQRATPATPHTLSWSVDASTSQLLVQHGGLVGGKERGATAFDGVRLCQIVGMLLEGSLGELGLAPQVGREETVRVGDGVEGGARKVAFGLGVALRGRVAVLDARHLQNLLRRWRGHNAGTPRRRHEANANGAALARKLDGHRVGEADLAAPIATAHGDERAFGRVDPAEDGKRHLLGRLLAKANVTVIVANRHIADEARALTGRGLLLHGLNLHYLILQLVARHEEVRNLELLDRHREEVELLERLDLTVAHKAAELRARHPLALALCTTPPAVTTATATVATATAAVAAVAAATATIAEATTEATTSTITTATISHLSLAIV